MQGAGDKQYSRALAPGFPTLRSLAFEAKLAFHHVTVFELESKNDSMVLTLPVTEVPPLAQLAPALLLRRCGPAGENRAEARWTCPTPPPLACTPAVPACRCFIKYPMLVEALIIAVCDGASEFTAHRTPDGAFVSIQERKLSQQERHAWTAATTALVGTPQRRHEAACACRGALQRDG